MAIVRDKSAKIRALNDRLRKSLTGGRVVMTRAVSALPDAVRARALELTLTFGEFTAEIVSWYKEHDFGSFEVDGHKFFFTRHYDKSTRYGSEDPTYPEKTTRVLTIMLAEEYSTRKVDKNAESALHLP